MPQHALLSLSSGGEIRLENLLRMRHSAALLPLAQQRKVLHQQSGGHRSALRGRGLEFSEVRAYQSGDDIRHMDWRVTAKRGQPHIKLFQEERERPVLLLCDLRANMHFGSRRALKKVLAADVCALLAWAAQQAGDRVGALLFSESHELTLRPQHGNKGALQLCHQLAQLPQSHEVIDAKARMQHMCREVHRVARPGTRIYIISDWLGFDEQAQQALFKVARHCDIVALHISDPLERELPPPGHYSLMQGTKRLHIDSHSATARLQYQQHFAQELSRLQQRLQALAIPLIKLSTDEPDLLMTLRQGLGLSPMRRLS